MSKHFIDHILLRALDTFSGEDNMLFVKLCAAVRQWQEEETEEANVLLKIVTDFDKLLNILDK
jgi:hypothetical protein